MSVMYTAPHERIGFPDDLHAGSMTIRQERAAIAAMETLRAMGAGVGPVHRIPNGLGYVAPNTGHDHGPGARCWLEHRSGVISADHPQLWTSAQLVHAARLRHAWKLCTCSPALQREGRHVTTCPFLTRDRSGS